MQWRCVREPKTKRREGKFQHSKCKRIEACVTTGKRGLVARRASGALGGQWIQCSSALGGHPGSLGAILAVQVRCVQQARKQQAPVGRRLCSSSPGRVRDCLVAAETLSSGRRACNAPPADQVGNRPAPCTRDLQGSWLKEGSSDSSFQPCPKLRPTKLY